MIKLILNSIFTIIGTIYFFFYYFLNYNPVFFEFFIKYTWWKEFYSILNWVIAFFLIIWIMGLLTGLFEKIFNKFFPKNVLLWFLLKTIGLTKYFLGLYIFTYYSIIPTSYAYVLKKVYSIGIIIILLISITSIVSNVFKYKILKNPKLKLQQESKTLIPFIEKVIITIMWIMGFITIFSSLGYNVNAFIAWAWIWGLAIAFAAQKSISNIFGAITILLNKPFKVWDSVQINGITGTIKDIGLTYVELTESNWHKVMVPNDSIMSSNIENFSTRKNKKTFFTIWITYDITTIKLKKWIDVIKEILEKYKTEKTIASYRVNFSNFWDFSLNIDILYYSLYNDDSEYWLQRENLNFEIKTAFEKLQIDIAFPTQEVVIKNQQNIT